MKPNSERIIEFFSEAMAISSPDERARFLDKACQDEPEVREEVESLLRAGEPAADFLKQPPPGPERMGDLVTEKPGDVFGPYKLLQQIGEGGFGVVWMAEQSEPILRKVALKVIKAGMDSKQVLARFEAERQALAMMDHPNIARVFDAGATPTGRPYFAMELVKGIPITEFCDQQKLGTRQRLELFCDVCSAVNHAHQKGIIHRDLKPSNVMMTLDGDRGVAKVIDFGIAKATELKLTDKTLFTRFEQFLGTPVYMSPEQAAMSATDIDTRSDIYSLGMLLYELLAGRPAFDPKTLLAAGYDEMRRIIKEDEPPRPSVTQRRTQSHTGAVPDTSGNSALHTSQSALDPDLDWIVMKCLEKDRSRRYETANALAADLQRHLTNEPVVARPASKAYRVQKAFRRNRLAFTAAAAVAMALLAGGLVSTWQAIEARQARDAEKQERLRTERRELVARQNGYASDMNLVQRALEDGNYGLARDSLEAHRPASGREDLRAFEWRYFWKLSQGESWETWRGHSNSVNCLAVSRDGKTLASGSSDGSIHLRDLASGRVTRLLVNAAVYSVAFSADGLFLAAGNENGPTQLWELASGRVISTFDAEWRPSVFFSPVGALLAVSSGGDIVHARSTATVSVWDCTRQPQRIRKTFTESGGQAAFSPDGKILAIGSHNDAIKLWDIGTGDLRQTLKNSGSVISLAFSPDGQQLVASNWKGDVVFWDLVTGHQGTPLSGHTARVWSVAFSPDGHTLATASSDQTVGLWDVVSQKSKGRLKGHGREVFSVAFIQDGKELVSASNDGTLKLWSAEPKKETEGNADHLALSPSYDAAVRQGRPQAISYGVFVFSEDALLMAAPGEDGVNVWDMAAKPFPKTIQTIPNEIRSLALTDAGRTLVTIAPDYALRFWDWEKKLVRSNVVLSATDDPVRTAQLDPGAKVLATGTRNGRVSFWNPASGSSLGSIQAHRRMVWGLVFSPDGRLLATASDDNTAKIIDVKTQSELAVLNSHNGAVYDVAFSPDGRLLATAGHDDGAKLWEVSTGKVMSTLRGHKEGVHNVAFAPDGRTLATVDDRTIKLWHIATHRELATFKDERGINYMAFSPDGRKLGATGVDGTLRFWSAPTLAEIDAAEREAGK